MKKKEEQAEPDEQVFRMELWVALHELPKFISRNDPDETDWKLVRDMIDDIEIIAFNFSHCREDGEYKDENWLTSAQIFLTKFNKKVNDNPHH